MEKIRAAAGVEGATVEDRRVTCVVHGSFEPLLDAVRDVEVVDLVSTEPSLEEIFLTYYENDPRPRADALPRGDQEVLPRELGE